MTNGEEITEKRKEYWKEADITQMGEELERIIDRIDGMGDRIHGLENEVANLNLRMDSLEFATKVTTIGGAIGSTIKLGPPPEPFPGYNELMEEALPVLKAAIAKKKLESESKPQVSVPYTED